jgi:hypothetical protein
LAVGAVRSGAALEKTLEPELYLPSSQAFQPGAGPRLAECADQASNTCPPCNFFRWFAGAGVGRALPYP